MTGQHTHTHTRTHGDTQTDRQVANWLHGQCAAQRGAVQCGNAARRRAGARRDTHTHTHGWRWRGQVADDAATNVSPTNTPALADSAPLPTRHTKRNCADTTGTVPVPRAGQFQCKNTNIYFSDEIHGSNCIKQHPETVMV